MNLFTYSISYNNTNSYIHLPEKSGSDAMGDSSPSKTNVSSKAVKDIRLALMSYETSYIIFC